ncbi:hypothetical protein L6164_002406 [Bauhinia variegata]|uniref:Uncharacterized protein n=1 Tax=Bauhinia variegata TaxID=167791 RepID=A0ACB9PXK0_BAUVA|nr:hypothetical protein L6164_002406 [Bauhinia variegata]
MILNLEMEGNVTLHQHLSPPIGQIVAVLQSSARLIDQIALAEGSFIGHKHQEVLDLSGFTYCLLSSCPSFLNHFYKFSSEDLSF